MLSLLLLPSLLLLLLLLLLRLNADDAGDDITKRK